MVIERTVFHLSPRLRPERETVTVTSVEVVMPMFPQGLDALFKREESNRDAPL